MNVKSGTIEFQDIKYQEGFTDHWQRKERDKNRINTTNNRGKETGDNNTYSSLVIYISLYI